MARGQDGALYNYVGYPSSDKECGYNNYREIMSMTGKRFYKKQAGKYRRNFNKNLTILYSQED